ncbi:unnamed protein product [Blepharisma stoltei]|uniref:EF-hand domain-containing protein n=1 Tax=Blepharisma stoltei TaxID=1481888 RepID=A0AAU9IW30_9CILI|nr:unnamed protein product [Blepharisma stoltei]
MSGNWQVALYEKAKKSKTLAILSEEYQRGKGLTQDWIKKSREIADRSTFLILAGADELCIWTLTNFDKQIHIIYGMMDWRNIFLWASKNRILEDFQSQVRKQYDGTVNKYIKHTKLYENFTLRLVELSNFYQKNYEECKEIISTKTHNAKEKIDNLIFSIKNINAQDILEKEWPQNFLDQVDSLLTYFGGQKFAKKLHDGILDKLDHDEDGVLTIGDIYESTNANKIAEWSRQQANYFSKLFIVNGQFN